MNWVSYIFPQRVADRHSVYNHDISVIQKNDRHELLVNGIQQSGAYTTKLWTKGLQRLITTPKKRVDSILVFGVGGGTVFPMLRRVYPRAHIIGVDIDKEIIALGKTYFGLDQVSGLSLVCRDARQFIQSAKRKKQRFDMIIIDLYIGNDVPEFVSQTPLLKSVKLILAHDGNVIINYFSFFDQKKKSEELHTILSNIYQSVRSQPILHNQFFYCGKIG